MHTTSRHRLARVEEILGPLETIDDETPRIGYTDYRLKHVTGTLSLVDSIPLLPKGVDILLKPHLVIRIYKATIEYDWATWQKVTGIILLLLIAFLIHRWFL